jgi:type 1 glutamine amidotransferase
MSAPHVVFVAGDHEYSGEVTLPLLAAELGKHYGFETTVLQSFPDQNAEEDIPGLEALATADLTLFYLRWRQLPADQVRHIEDYLRAGKPVIGLRTTSHGFRYPAGHPLERWNGWAAEAFGAPPGWGVDGHTHYGHQSSTEVSVVEAAARHPILNGVTGPFQVRSWLYHVLPKWPPADAARLLMGKALSPNKPAPDNPVAWAGNNAYGGRAFFTTLGHPEDFTAEPLQRLMVNAVHWCLGMAAPDPWRGPFKMDAPYRGMV